VQRDGDAGAVSPRKEAAVETASREPEPAPVEVHKPKPRMQGSADATPVVEAAEKPKVKPKTAEPEERLPWLPPVAPSIRGWLSVPIFKRFWSLWPGWREWRSSSAPFSPRPLKSIPFAYNLTYLQFWGFAPRLSPGAMPEGYQI